MYREFFYSLGPFLQTETHKNCSGLKASQSSATFWALSVIPSGKCDEMIYTLTSKGKGLSFSPLPKGFSSWVSHTHFLSWAFIFYMLHLTDADKRRVDAFEMWCYRRVLRIPWTERKTNAWVLDKIGNRLMLREMVRRRKLRFSLWTCNSKEGTRKNDHHREGQRKEKERSSPNIMAQGHQELYRDDTARGCESSRG